MHHLRAAGSHAFLCLPAGQLVAVGVLDVLPSLTSSVYFFWDPDIAPLSPGLSQASPLRSTFTSMCARHHNLLSP